MKVPGSSHGKPFYLRFFLFSIKNRHEEHKGHAMIFMCGTKSVKTPFLDRDDDIRQQPPSHFQKQTDKVRFVTPDGSEERAKLVR